MKQQRKPVKRTIKTMSESRDGRMCMITVVEDWPNGNRTSRTKHVPQRASDRQLQEYLDH